MPAQQRQAGVHGEHNRAFGPVELFNKVAGATLEVGQRVDVFADVKHRVAQPQNRTKFGATSSVYLSSSNSGF